MEINAEYTVAKLNKTMPEKLDRTVNAKFQYDNWNLLDTTDVWTADGWVVCAAFSPYVFGLRKGDKQIVASFDADEPMYFNTNPKIEHYGI